MTFYGVVILTVSHSDLVARIQHYTPPKGINIFKKKIPGNKI